MKHKYRIPIMSIQDYLMSLEKSPEFIKLSKFCKSNKTQGYTDYVFDFELERQWYPVLITNDKWLAQKVMRTFCTRVYKLFNKE